MICFDETHNVKCLGCGLVYSIADDIEDGGLCHDCGTKRIRELTREVESLRSELETRLTLEQVCERLNSIQLTDIDCFDNLVDRKGGFLLRCNLVAEEFGFEFDETKYGFSVFEPTL